MRLVCVCVCMCGSLALQLPSSLLIQSMYGANAIISLRFHWNEEQMHGAAFVYDQIFFILLNFSRIWCCRTVSAYFLSCQTKPHDEFATIIIINNLHILIWHDGVANIDVDRVQTYSRLTNHFLKKTKKKTKKKDGKTFYMNASEYKFDFALWCCH